MIKDIFMEQKNIDTYVKNFIRSIIYIRTSKGKIRFVTELFQYLEFLRSPRTGLKNKYLGYKYFLELYNYFPDLCIELVKSNLLISIGYYKDLYLIWKLILDINMEDKIKYLKYNKLIETIKHNLIFYREKDIQKVVNLINYNNLENLSNTELFNIVKNEKLNITFIGKYCLRENSSLSKKLYWYDKFYNKLDYFDYMGIIDRRSYRKINSKLYFLIKNNNIKIDYRDFKTEISNLILFHRLNILKKIE